jgi:adenosine kinase
VGDAFRAGFLTGMSKNFDWQLCGRIGSLAATYVIEQQGPQNHAYTAKEFVSRFRNRWDDKQLLDQFIT